MTSFAVTADEIHLQMPDRLEAEAAAALRGSFEQLVASQVRRVILDLSGVTQMDGSGLGAIAFLFKRLTARGGSVSLRGVKGQPLAMLEDLGLSRVLGLRRSNTPMRRWVGSHAAAKAA